MPEESDELAENGFPICYKTGICKHLLHDDAVKSGLSCCPPTLLLCSGFARTMQTMRNAAFLAPDALNLPTLQALGWMDIETGMSIDDFSDCAAKWLSTERIRIAGKRGSNG